MNLTKILLVVSIMFASFIEVGCGSTNPTTNGYNQYQTGYNTGYTGYNNGYNNGALACGSGQSYMNNNISGACQPGYISQGTSCVCQSGVTGLPTNTTTATNNQCQLAGYYFVQGTNFSGCYSNAQNLCYQGYVYVPTLGPQGMCVQHQ